MGIDIHKIPLGVANCYVIKDEGGIMIDSGTPKKGKRFIKSLKKLSSKESRPSGPGFAFAP